jgi:alcohol dehydrogenase, propanol-preferring
VINAIAKEPADLDYLLRLEYQHHLWMEKEIKSVANITRQDVREFLGLAAKVPLKPTVQEFRLEEANSALTELKEGKIRGVKVLRVRYRAAEVRGQRSEGRGQKAGRHCFNRKNWLLITPPG